MKKQLLTLSATIETELETLKVLEPQEKEPEKILSRIFKAHHLLKQTLTLSQFIATDSEGNPMEEPKPIVCKEKVCKKLDIDGNCNCSFIDEENQYYYQQTKANVIFEGWELEISNKTDFIINNGFYELAFLKVKEGFIIRFCLVHGFPTKYARPESFLELAILTKDNPLPLVP